jgi:rod shape-determining protein MreD
MTWSRQIVRAIVIVLLQVLLFNHLQIAGWGFPMVYVLILMNLPANTPRWAEMLIGAVLGLIFDVLNTSLGVNMAACVAFTFIRPIILAHLVQDLERVKGEVYIRSIGTIEYIRTLVFLTVLHHLMVFSLEAWSLHNWWMVIIQTLLSSLMTLTIIIGYNIVKR